MFKHWSSQTNDLKIYTCCFLVRHSTLLGYGKNWLAQYQDNMTVWDIGSWCQQPNCDKVTDKSRHECALSQIGTYPEMLLGCKITNKTKQMDSQPPIYYRVKLVVSVLGFCQI